MIDFIEPAGLLHIATFSQVAVAQGSRMIFTSGQVAIDEKGELVGAGDIAAQTRQAMQNLELALAAAGASFADVVKTTPLSSASIRTSENSLRRLKSLFTKAANRRRAL